MKPKVTVCITGDIDTFEIETIEGCLKPYFQVLQRYEVKMTIPITAKAVEDYPKRAEFILKQGHEVAMHGDVHQPFYGSVEEQTKRLEKGKRIFNDILGFTPLGFRAPWVRHNGNTYLSLIKTGFLYDSSQERAEVPLWMPLIKKFPYDLRVFPLIKPFLRLAKPFSRSAMYLGRLVYPLIEPPAKPAYLRHQLVELPITTPDDYHLISYQRGPRYSAAQAHRIAEVWLDILGDMKRRKNRLFVVQAHPGRMSPKYIEAIELFLKALRNDSKIEIKAMEEVAQSFIAEQKEAVS
jgi:peptidoglycan/xylan/chitin deacetylase (PgdA/CDA1 family)